ncbi:uncharacterized protein A4U43_C09F6310 [Asparagus officinalis]|uniref:Ribosomal silencing factor RsfS n=1 Tax=Asparagus officinalis TaxID=4686 RepID=A0A5P1E5R3_ASPOF|nr:protein Iojap-related, mitochondrial [Asparagus officinalis]ONK57971.1 uncharacterized protein A4U43_C09F6310 [Asparagus officinalis]
MFSALRSRARSSISIALCRHSPLNNQTLGFPLPAFFSSSSKNLGFLNIEEVQKILDDVKADDVKVIPMKDDCDWTDFMVIATGRSTWHVKNIAQALIYKVKQKQVGSDRKLLPSVEGQESGNWIVVDSGTVIIHALDEKARAYYNLENLWMKEKSPKLPSQDVENAIVKTRRKNNSKKPMKSAAKS